MYKRTLTMTWTFAIAAILASHCVLAQYPSRPVEMIVPIAPGGGMDLQARLLAELVEPELGQRVVVMNRAGAGGIRLDAIFIDEGFGSLDAESLDYAIQTLKGLQQSGRLVGIISHVPELQECVDARVEVISGMEGSVVRVWV